MVINNKSHLSTPTPVTSLTVIHLPSTTAARQSSHIMRSRGGGRSCSSPSPTLTCTLLRHVCDNPATAFSSVDPVPITLRLPQQLQSDAAVKIQSSYRAHLIRTLFTKIATVHSQTNALQSLIQRQETVDAIRSSQIEKLKMNEALMSLLLKLDSVPGIDPTLREARRKVSRQIVGLQEILDGISDSNLEGKHWSSEELWWNWDEEMAEMEKQVCEERGGEELERYCAQYLGFRCLQRFLREP